ncbi:MAG: HNH endonuclease [Kofleriaceae bacterium]
MSAKHLRMLGVVATDDTFTAQILDGQRVWVGKCIHCAAKLVLSDSGRPLGAATLEHIWPQALGGGNELENLALACDRCNRQKGSRHDHQRAEDPRLLAVVATLRERRQARWRDPARVGLAARVAGLSRWRGAEPGSD